MSGSVAAAKLWDSGQYENAGRKKQDAYRLWSIQNKHEADRVWKYRMLVAIDLYLASIEGRGVRTSSQRMGATLTVSATFFLALVAAARVDVRPAGAKVSVD